MLSWEIHSLTTTYMEILVAVVALYCTSTVAQARKLSCYCLFAGIGITIQYLTTTSSQLLTPRFPPERRHLTTTALSSKYRYKVKICFINQPLLKPWMHWRIMAATMKRSVEGVLVPRSIHSSSQCFAPQLYISQLGFWDFALYLSNGL